MTGSLPAGSVCIVALAVAFSTLAKAGPLSPLYLSTGSTIEVLQGTTILDSWTTGEQEYSIAVLDTVRTWSQGNPALSLLGHEYTLDGTPTGASYPNTVGCCFRDGTTDGQFNYAIRQVAGPYEVYRFNLDWTNPQLFQIPSVLASSTLSGIAYDPTDDSFWLALAGNFASIAHIRRDGSLISTFSGGAASPFVSLAYDVADDTLWLYITRPSGQSELVQFAAADTTGPNFALSRQSHASSVFAIDFRLEDAPTGVPEPTAALLMGTGILLIARLRAVRRTSARRGTL